LSRDSCSGRDVVAGEARKKSGRKRPFRARKVTNDPRKDEIGRMRKMGKRGGLSE